MHLGVGDFKHPFSSLGKNSAYVVEACLDHRLLKEQEEFLFVLAHMRSGIRHTAAHSSSFMC